MHASAFKQGIHIECMQLRLGERAEWLRGALACERLLIIEAPQPQRNRVLTTVNA
jgi:hypothetical protein